MSDRSRGVTYEPSGVDDAFGHWLAGLIDGEGCFGIYASNAHKGHDDWRLTFQLQLRDDDEPVLREIHGRLLIGSVWRQVPNRPWDAKPTLTWGVYSRAHCKALAAILDRFPLRTKKARDYAIWRAAPAVSPWRRAELARLRDELVAGRAYEARPLPPVEPDPQLEIFNAAPVDHRVACEDTA